MGINSDSEEDYLSGDSSPANSYPVASLFNPARQSRLSHRYFANTGQQNYYRTAWLSSYFFFQGEVCEPGNDGFLSVFRRAYINAFLQLVKSQVAKSLVDNDDKDLIDISKCKTYIGAIDYLNPLIELSLLSVAAARSMHLKCLALKSEDEKVTSAYRALKTAQICLNVLVAAPLFIVAVPMVLVWDLTKALLSVILATLTACVLAPEIARRHKRSYTD